MAEKLGFPEQQQAVGDYYHEMEYGTLESSGVSDKVLDALGEILGTAGDALRRSGELVSGGENRPVGGIVFTRVETISDVGYELNDSTKDEPGSDLENSGPELDRQEVDDLFTGGR